MFNQMQKLMEATKDATKWYKVVRAQFVIYTDSETGKVISRNLVMLEGCVYRTFEYPQDGAKLMLLKVGDSVKIEGSPHSGKVVMIK